ncbi:MAG: S8 family serine peptidase [Hydrogenothermaceae bacterium]|nr:S8 family serine peptidase [Hydrogenothermaceae bacterium]
MVAVIDSGVKLDHPDLKDNIWKNPGETDCNNGIDDDNNGYIDDCYGWNFVDNNNNPMDDDGHGTHIAGIIGAVTNNSTGVAGVNWKIKIMPVKILDSNGNGDLLTLVKALKYAADNGAKVVNLSLGYPSSCTYVDSSQALKDAIDYVKSKNVIIVAAAGNYSCDDDVYPFYPATLNVDNIISVGSSSSDDKLSYFSNYGKNSVDILAPGENIVSTYIDQTGYKSLSGTSMATPFVTGAVALILSNKTDIPNPFAVRDLIVNSADKNSYIEDKVIGGILNLFSAFNSQLSPIKPLNISYSAVSSSTGSSPQAVTISWEKRSNIVEKFVVERMQVGSVGGMQAGSWNVVAELSANETSYTDNTVSGGVTYQYRIGSVYQSSISYSDPITVSVPAPTPTSSPSSSSSGGGGGCHLISVNIYSYLMVILLILIRKFNGILLRRIYSREEGKG